MEGIDTRFKYEVAKHLNGRLSTNCDTCGVCSSSCPVAEYVEEFDPRRIIRMITLGYKDRVLGSTTIWYCALCNTCTVVCPQDVRFKEVIEIIRKMAVAEKYVSPSFLDDLDQIEKECQVYRCEKIASRILELNPEIKKGKI